MLKLLDCWWNWKKNVLEGSNHFYGVLTAINKTGLQPASKPVEQEEGFWKDVKKRVSLDQKVKI